MTAGRKVITENKHWGTPPQYVNAVRECFGGIIHLDPCSNQFSIVRAEVEYQLPQNDGLKESWNFTTIYVNPPYGRDQDTGTTIKDWLVKCEEANRLYGSEVIALIPVATNTAHWKKYIYPRATAVCFLYDTRLKFLEEGQGGGKGAPMSCAMVYWGNNYPCFYTIFIKFGAVIDLQPLRDVTIGDMIGKEDTITKKEPGFKKEKVVQLMHQPIQNNGKRGRRRSAAGCGCGCRPRRHPS